MGWDMDRTKTPSNLHINVSQIESFSVGPNPLVYVQVHFSNSFVLISYLTLEKQSEMSWLSCWYGLSHRPISTELTVIAQCKCKMAVLITRVFWVHLCTVGWSGATLSLFVPIAQPHSMTVPITMQAWPVCSPLLYTWFKPVRFLIQIMWWERDRILMKVFSPQTSERLTSTQFSLDLLWRRKCWNQ